MMKQKFRCCVWAPIVMAVSTIAVPSTAQRVAPAVDRPGLDAPVCKAGFVWRKAAFNDFVCVTPESRNTVRTENANSQLRINPNSRARNCRVGLVWREAFDQDQVCVTPARRAAVRLENRVHVDATRAPNRISTRCPAPVGTTTSQDVEWNVSEQVANFEGQWVLECTYSAPIAPPHDYYSCAKSTNASFACEEIGIPSGASSDPRVINSGYFSSFGADRDLVFDLETGDQARRQSSYVNRKRIEHDFRLSFDASTGKYEIEPTRRRRDPSTVRSGELATEQVPEQLVSPEYQPVQGSLRRDFCERAIGQSDGFNSPPIMDPRSAPHRIGNTANVGRHYCIKTFEGNIGAVTLVDYKEERSGPYFAFEYTVWRNSFGSDGE